MSGCLDNAHCPSCDIDLGEKRNTIASVLAGGLVSDLTIICDLFHQFFSFLKSNVYCPSFNRLCHGVFLYIFVHISAFIALNTKYTKLQYINIELVRFNMKSFLIGPFANFV